MFPWPGTSARNYYAAWFTLFSLCGGTFLLFEVTSCSLNRTYNWWKDAPYDWDEQFVRRRAWESGGELFHPGEKRAKEQFYRAMCKLWLPPKNEAKALKTLLQHLRWEGLNK